MNTHSERAVPGSASLQYTVLGASGFIGSHLADRLRATGAHHFAPLRWTDEVFERPLGHVIYCIGLTADWRTRPYDTVRAHVERLQALLERARYESLLYLSSTRVYKRAPSAAEESPLVACPVIADDLFDLSKMLGEALCMTGPPSVRVARLSNVYGNDYKADNFLSSVIRDAIRGRVVLKSHPSSAKDYVGIDEVVELLLRIGTTGRERIYNVASGKNTSHEDILAALAAETGCHVEIDSNAPALQFPPIEIDRIATEFHFVARPVVQALRPLVEDFRAHRNTWETT